MPLQFPSSASIGQIYSSGSSPTYVFNGEAWDVQSAGIASVTSASFALSSTSASFAVSSSRAVTSSFALTAVSASFATTASFVKLDAGKVLISETGSWSVTNGTNVYSFTVPQDNTYVMYVRGNIPNGIITWNATATITNNNVPVVGAQYCWVYTGGGTPLNITAIPDQFVGTSGSIMRTTGGGITIPSNTFRFTIANSSGTTQTVHYGYTQL
jgi:hypothetical protein